MKKFSPIGDNCKFEFSPEGAESKSNMKSRHLLIIGVFEAVQTLSCEKVVYYGEDASLWSSPHHGPLDHTASGHCSNLNETTE